MTTIRDVAEKAGVSITTVSHVINGTRYVSAELTQKVYDAMAELDYTPNILARGLRSGRTKTIGLVIPDISNAFFAEFSRKIEDEGFASDYSVILCNTDENPAKEDLYINVLIAKQVDGLIFFGTENKAGLQSHADASNIPIVIVDRELDGIDADVVMIDNFAGGFQATEYLLSLNHSRIGCISGPSPIRPSAQRMDGYKAALAKAGLPFVPELLQAGDFRFEGGERGMLALLDLPEPPTAVFACNDMMALGAIGAINRAGLRVPEDISVIGFDDAPLASLVFPPLTTISQPVKEMAGVAVSLLIEKIDFREERKHQKDLKPDYQRIILAPELIVRGTCAALPD